MGGKDDDDDDDYDEPYRPGEGRVTLPKKLPAKQPTQTEFNGMTSSKQPADAPAAAVAQPQEQPAPPVQLPVPSRVVFSVTGVFSIAVDYDAVLAGPWWFVLVNRVGKTKAQPDFKADKLLMEYNGEKYPIILGPEFVYSGHWYQTVLVRGDEDDDA